MEIANSPFYKLLTRQALAGPEIALLKKKKAAAKRYIQDFRFTEYHNWGIEYAGAGAKREMLSREAQFAHLQRHNWRFWSLDLKERKEFMERVEGINQTALLGEIERAVSANFGRFPIAGFSVFGSTLYGRKDQKPNDLDIMVLLKDASFTANPVPARSRYPKKLFFPNAARTVEDGDLGMTIIGTKQINPRSSDENVKAFSLVYWGETVPLYGDPFCQAAPPLAAYLPWPYRVLGWAFKDVIANQDDARVINKGISRLEMISYIMKFVSSGMGLTLKSGFDPKGLWREADAQKNGAQGLTKVFLANALRAGRIMQDLELQIKAQALAQLQRIS